MKVFITRYAFYPSGIVEMEGEIDRHLFEEEHDEYETGEVYDIGEWFLDRASAVKRAEEMKEEKLASLRNKIEEIEAIAFGE